MPEKLLKHKNFIVLTPEKRGDFNDFREDEFEIRKLKILKRPLFNKMQAKIYERTYFDPVAQLIENRELTLITGKTLSLKSTGGLSYVLDVIDNRPIMYYSDERPTEAVMATARALGKEHLLIDVPLDDIAENNLWYDFAMQLKEAHPDDKPAFMFFDPPPSIQGSSNDEKCVRTALKTLQNLARQTTIPIGATRNYSKNEDEKNELEKIAGSASFYNVTRRILIAKECEIGSKLRKTKDDPITSVLYCAKSNEGPMPKKIVQFTLKTMDIDTDDGKKRNQGYTTSKLIDREHKIEHYTKAHNTQALEDKKARLFIPLLMGPMLRAEWMDLNKDRASKATLENSLAEAYEKGFLEKTNTGEGKTGRKIKLSLTDKGFKFYGGGS